MRRPVIFTIAALAATALAHADVYKSVDAKGEVSYSDVWSPGATLIKGLSMKNGQLATEEDSSPPPPRVTNDHTPDPSKLAAQKAVSQDLAATRATQCAALKDQYAKEIRALRIRKPGSTDDDPQYMSVSDADAERVRTKQAMDEACGGDTSQ